MKKHWTEPKGIFLINIPVEWQYRNVAIEGGIEEPPYSFEPYDDAIGCFQISCYPLAELAPNHKTSTKKQRKIEWTHQRMDNENFNTHVYFASIKDQALIGKYIYATKDSDDKRIQEQLLLVNKVLKSIIVVPENERIIASNLDKYDRFLSSLIGSYDLLYSAIESESYIEIVILSANQIDAFLRLSIVLAKQIIDSTDEIDVKYIYQDESDKGMIERTIFENALKYNVINKEQFTRLSELYDFRNRMIHRYIISKIKTVDMFSIVESYLKTSEEMRLQLRNLEDQQNGKDYGIYGHNFVRAKSFDEEDIQRVHSMANDKHLLERFKRKIGKSET